MKKYLLAGAALLSAAFLSSSPSYAVGPSFDCRAAAYADEVAICLSPLLSSTDILINTAFTQAKRYNRAAAVATARAHIAQRRACGADASCIYNSQLYAGASFQSLGATVFDQGF